LHDGECGIGTRNKPTDPTQNDPIDRKKWQPTWLTPTQYDDLLSEHQDFGFQRRSRPKQVNDQAEDQPAEIPHPTQDCPILRRLPTGSDLRQGQGKVDMVIALRNVRL
jgi:hypothetical protein